MKTLLIFALFLYVHSTASAQTIWEKIPIDDDVNLSLSINCLYNYGDKLYAGASSANNKISDIFIQQNKYAFYQNGIYPNNGNPYSIGSLLRDSVSLYAGTLTQGLYKGVGNSWSQITNGLPSSISVQALAKLNNNLLAGTNNGGIYRSTDSGYSWSQTNGVQDIVRSFLGSGSTIYAATQNQGVYASSDNGQNWSKISAQKAQHCYSFCKVNGKIYVGSYEGIFEITNNGQTLTQFSKLKNREICLVGDEKSQNIFVGDKSNDNSGSVFKVSPDGDTADVTYNMGRKRVFSLALLDNYLYSATESGIFRADISALNGPPQKDTIRDSIIVDTTIYGGMYNVSKTLRFEIMIPEEKYVYSKAAWEYSNNGKASPVTSNQNGFKIYGDSDNYLRWTAPYKDDDILTNYNGPDTNKQMIIRGRENGTLITVLKTPPDSQPETTTATYKITVIPTLLSPIRNDEIDTANYSFIWHQCLLNRQSYYFYLAEGTQTEDNLLKYKPYPIVDTLISKQDYEKNATILELPLLQPGKTYTWMLCYDSVSNQRAVLGIRNFTTKSSNTDKIKLETNDKKPINLCVGESRKLNVTASGGNPFSDRNKYPTGYKYVWSIAPGNGGLQKVNGGNAGDSFITVSGTKNQTFTVAVTAEDSDGNKTGPVSITINILSSNNNITIKCDKTVICYGETLLLKADQGFDSYVWKDESGKDLGSNPNCSVSSYGTYYVTGKKIGFCDAYANITINQGNAPTINIVGNESVCLSKQNANYNANVSNGTFSEWQIIEGNELITTSDISKTPITITFNSAGSVTLRASGKSSDGCNGSSDKLITITAEPSSAITSDKTTMCAGETATLTNIDNGSDNNYEWHKIDLSNNKDIKIGVDNNISVNSSGEYYCIVSRNGCKKDDTNHVKITVNPLPDPTITFDEETATLSVDKPVQGETYQWVDPSGNKISGATNSSYKLNPPDTSGIFSVNITSEAKCSNTGSYTVDAPKTLAVFELLDLSGKQKITIPASKTLSDAVKVDLNVKSLEGALLAKLKVNYFHIKLTWDGTTVGMVNDPPAVILPNCIASLEYDIPSMSVQNGKIGNYDFLALTGGKNEAEIKPEITAFGASHNEIARAVIEPKPIVISIENTPELHRDSIGYFEIVTVRPNPARQELYVEIGSVSGSVPPLSVYLSDMTGKKLLTLEQTQEGVYRANCNNISAGIYMITATDGKEKQSTTLNIAR